MSNHIAKMAACGLGVKEMTISKQRTINSMKPKSQARARGLWEKMQNPLLQDSEFCAVRDDYHSMFKNNANFVDGTEAKSNDS